MVLAAGVAAAVMLAAGCGDRRVPTAAGGAGRALFMSDAASGATCAAGSCLLANTILPLQSGLYEPDSAALMVPLGEVLVQLQPGDSVTLAATVSPDLAASLPPDEQLVAVSGPDTVRTPLRGNSVGATIYRAVAADSVRIHVGLTRRLSASPRSGAFTVSVNYGSAPLLSAWTPWIAPSAPGAAATVGLAAPATTCTATAPGPSSCPDISVSIVPYAPGDPFGDFQSDPGTGVSNPITVTFSQPVTSVTITIEDPTYAGNAMTAYRADGSIAGSVSFTGSGIPGIDIPDTQTITAAGIVRIVLTPAPLDYVAYAGLTFTPAGLCKDSNGNPAPCPDMNVVLKWIRDSLNEPEADGNCARQCNHALGAGGMDTLARPVFRAYLYGPYLESRGAQLVATEATANYVPQRGDIEVVDRDGKDHADGHMAIYDGSDWLSSAVQVNILPTLPTPYPRHHHFSIYRFPSN